MSGDEWTWRSVSLMSALGESQPIREGAGNDFDVADDQAVQAANGFSSGSASAAIRNRTFVETWMLLSGIS